MDLENNNLTIEDIEQVNAGAEDEGMETLMACGCGYRKTMDGYHVGEHFDCPLCVYEGKVGTLCGIHYQKKPH